MEPLDLPEFLAKVKPKVEKAQREHEGQGEEKGDRKNQDPSEAGDAVPVHEEGEDAQPLEGIKDHQQLEKVQSDIIRRVLGKSIQGCAAERRPDQPIRVLEAVPERLGKERGNDLRSKKQIDPKRQQERDQEAGGELGHELTEKSFAPLFIDQLFDRTVRKVDQVIHSD